MAAHKTLDALNIIRDVCNQACKKDVSTETLTRASLATSAFNLAAEVRPEILEEIYRFHVSTSNSNLPPLESVSEKSAQGIKLDTMEKLAENIINHVGSPVLNPGLKNNRR